MTLLTQQTYIDIFPRLQGRIEVYNAVRFRNCPPRILVYLGLDVDAARHDLHIYVRMGRIPDRNTSLTGANYSNTFNLFHLLSDHVVHEVNLFDVYSH